MKSLQKIEEFFYGILVTWKKYPVDFIIKENAEPMCLTLYPVPKVHEKFFKKEVECLFLNS